MILRANMVATLSSEQAYHYSMYAQRFADDHNLDLLYASFFGSKLYGTNTPESDTDIKGVFLPKQRDLLLEQASNCCTLSTSTDSHKNSSEDQDIEFYSLHNFLRMVARGDTGAIDLLFSFTNPEAMLYISNDWRTQIINNINYLFNPLNTRAFVGYAIAQSMKYSVKGNRLAALEHVLMFIKKYADTDILNDHLDEILENCKNGTFVKEDFVAVKAGQECNIRGIRVLGKLHMGTIFMNEFRTRLQETYNKYGKRAQSAKDADGVDWKALSHAVRVTIQAQELLKTGKIVFPLKCAEQIKEIKAGKLPFDQVSDLLTEQIDEVDELIQNPEKCVKNQFNKTKQEQIILNFYGVK